MSEPSSSNDDPKCEEQSRLKADVYFLIQRFLSDGALQKTLQIFNEELEEQKILPKRIDWQGSEHDRSVDDMERQYPYIHRDFLYFLCHQASTSLNSNNHKTPSFLSFRPRARNRDGILHNYNQIFNCVSKIHGAPIQKLKESINMVNHVRSREVTGPLSRSRTIRPRFYKGIHKQRLTIGHLSAVYCLLFDHTGDFIITGADDLLIKMWSTHTARLIMVFRGASSEIADIAIDPENTLLAAGSLDRILRVWNMQTGVPVAVLTGQPGMITSVNFCPTPCWSVKYLISTGTDGSVAFWTYSHDNFGKAEFRNTPTLYQEKMRPGVAQMICSSFSPGGTFLATGSADHHVRVYYMKGDEGPQRILETEAHSDRVDSMQWAHSGLRFLSGSKDGVAIIWWFERQQWKSIHLVMATKLPSDTTQDENKKLRVTMVAWDFSDSIVITAVSDHTLKVWKATDGQLLKILTGHKDEVYVLESHPLDEDVLLSAGHDGQLFVWDINKGEIVAKYHNEIEGQGHSAIYDAKWSPEGSKIAASDSHGDIITFGFGSGSTYYEQLPKELFFHTDYRPLVRDQNYWVLDEQTQVPPHLMPPPFLVDMDGNPYPPMLQRLVPGRESCNLEQLVPNIVIGNGGSQEVIQEIPRRLLEESDEEQNRSTNQQQRSQRIRQSTGNWQSDPNMEWKRNILIPPLNSAMLERSNEIREHHNKLEMQEYQKQLRKRPLMINTSTPSSSKMREKRKAAGGKRTSIKPRPLKTNIVLSREELQNELAPISPIASDDSSGYSDWMEENERKERRSNRRNHRRNHQSIRKSGRRKRRTSGTSDDLDTDTDTEDSDISNSSLDSTQSEEEENVNDDSDVSPERNSNEDEKKERRNEKRKTPSKPQKENNRVVKVSKSSKPNSKTNSPKPATSKVPNSGPSSTKVSSVPKSPAPKVNSEPGPSTSGISINGGVSKQNKGPKIKKSESYKLSEWLSETRPKKSPYFPQMWDEIVYFVQGHQLYVEAVRIKSVYQEAVAELPWIRMPDLQDHEFCKVIDIQYQIKPPRLCVLKLAIQEEDGTPTGKVFSVRYHDMPDVLDFFVLKQTYTTAMSRNWKLGEKFRCMIDDNWWMGHITNKSPACDVFPESSFMCYEITWTNGEKERMSPWDMEPIDEQRLPEDEKAAITVLPNEITAILYKCSPDDWPDCERDTACKAISRGITQVMELAIAEPFLVPVDINEYPTYARVVEYPIDLSTIKARFENNFYRRLEAAKYDIGYLKTNAEKFNEKHSIIIKHARILTSLCLEIAQSGNNHIDIASVYHQLVDGYDSPCSDSSETEDKDVVVPKKEPESLPSTSRSLRSFPARSWKVQGDWKQSAKQLLDLIYENEDSGPFQAPVDLHKYPSYHALIDMPMDLGTVRNKLLKNQYSLPQDFAFDMRLIFENSKKFNTNKRSLIYIMTVRLATIFEDHMKKIINSWRQQRKRQRRRHTFSEGESDVSVSTADKSESADPPFVAEDKRSIDESDSDDTPLDVIRAKSLSQTNTEESDSNSRLTERPSERPPVVVKRPTKRKILQSDSDENSRTSEEEYKPPPSTSKVVPEVTSEEEEEEHNSKSESDSDSTRPRKSGLRQRPKRNRAYTQSDSDDDESLAKIRRKKRAKVRNDSSSGVENSNEVNGRSTSRTTLASRPARTHNDSETESSLSTDDTETDISTDLTNRDTSCTTPSTSSSEDDRKRKKSRNSRRSKKRTKRSSGRKRMSASKGRKTNLRTIKKPRKSDDAIRASSSVSNSNPESLISESSVKSSNKVTEPNDTVFNLGLNDDTTCKTPLLSSEIYSDNSCNVSFKKSDHSEFENQLSGISGEDSSFNDPVSSNNSSLESKKHHTYSNLEKDPNKVHQKPDRSSQKTPSSIDSNTKNVINRKSNCMKNLSELIHPSVSSKERVVTCYMLPSVQNDSPVIDSLENESNSEEPVIQTVAGSNLEISNNPLSNFEGDSCILPLASQSELSLKQTVQPLGESADSNRIDLSEPESSEANIQGIVSLNVEPIITSENIATESLESSSSSSLIVEDSEISKQMKTNESQSKTLKTYRERSSASPEPVASKKPRIQSDLNYEISGSKESTSDEYMTDKSVDNSPDNASTSDLHHEYSNIKEDESRVETQDDRPNKDIQYLNEDDSFSDSEDLFNPIITKTMPENLDDQSSKDVIDKRKENTVSDLEEECNSNITATTAGNPVNESQDDRLDKDVTTKVIQDLNDISTGFENTADDLSNKNVTDNSIANLNDGFEEKYDSISQANTDDEYVDEIQDDLSDENVSVKGIENDDLTDKYDLINKATTDDKNVDEIQNDRLNKNLTDKKEKKISHDASLSDFESDENSIEENEASVSENETQNTSLNKGDDLLLDLENEDKSINIPNSVVELVDERPDDRLNKDAIDKLQNVNDNAPQSDLETDSLEYNFIVNTTAADKSAKESQGDQSGKVLTDERIQSLNENVSLDIENASNESVNKIQDDLSNKNVTLKIIENVNVDLEDEYDSISKATDVEYVVRIEDNRLNKDLTEKKGIESMDATHDHWLNKNVIDKTKNIDDDAPQSDLESDKSTNESQVDRSDKDMTCKVIQVLNDDVLLDFESSADESVDEIQDDRSEKNVILKRIENLNLDLEDQYDSVSKATTNDKYVKEIQEDRLNKDLTVNKATIDDEYVEEIQDGQNLKHDDLLSDFKRDENSIKSNETDDSMDKTQNDQSNKVDDFLSAFENKSSNEPNKAIQSLDKIHDALLNKDVIDDVLLNKDVIDKIQNRNDAIKSDLETDSPNHANVANFKVEFNFITASTTADKFMNERQGDRLNKDVIDKRIQSLNDDVLLDFKNTVDESVGEVQDDLSNKNITAEKIEGIENLNDDLKDEYYLINKATTDNKIIQSLNDDLSKNLTIKRIDNSNVNLEGEYNLVNKATANDKYVDEPQDDRLNQNLIDKEIKKLKHDDILLDFKSDENFSKPNESNDSENESHSFRSNKVNNLQLDFQNENESINKPDKAVESPETEQNRLNKDIIDKIQNKNYDAPYSDLETDSFNNTNVGDIELKYISSITATTADKPMSEGSRSDNEVTDKLQSLDDDVSLDFENVADESMDEIQDERTNKKIIDKIIENLNDYLEDEYDTTVNKAATDYESDNRLNKDVIDKKILVFDIDKNSIIANESNESVDKTQNDRSNKVDNPLSDFKNESKSIIKLNKAVESVNEIYDDRLNKDVINKIQNINDDVSHSDLETDSLNNAIVANFTVTTADKSVNENQGGQSDKDFTHETRQSLNDNVSLDFKNTADISVNEVQYDLSNKVITAKRIEILNNDLEDEHNSVNKADTDDKRLQSLNDDVLLDIENSANESEKKTEDNSLTENVTDKRTESLNDYLEDESESINKTTTDEIQDDCFNKDVTDLLIDESLIKGNKSEESIHETQDDRSNKDVSEKVIQNLDDNASISDFENDYDAGSNRSGFNSDVPDSPAFESDVEDPFTGPETRFEEPDLSLKDDSEEEDVEGDLGNSFDPLSALDNEEFENDDLVYSDEDLEEEEKETDEVDLLDQEEDVAEAADINPPNFSAELVAIETVTEFINEINSEEQNIDAADPFSNVNDIVDPFNDVSDNVENNVVDDFGNPVIEEELDVSKTVLNAVPIQAFDLDIVKVESEPNFDCESNFSSDKDDYIDDVEESFVSDFGDSVSDEELDVNNTILDVAPVQANVKLNNEQNSNSAKVDFSDKEDDIHFCEGSEDNESVIDGGNGENNISDKIQTQDIENKENNKNLVDSAVKVTTNNLEENDTISHNNKDFENKRSEGEEKTEENKETNQNLVDSATEVSASNNMDENNTITDNNKDFEQEGAEEKGGDGHKDEHGTFDCEDIEAESILGVEKVDEKLKQSAEACLNYSSNKALSVQRPKRPPPKRKPKKESDSDYEPSSSEWENSSDSDYEISSKGSGDMSSSDNTSKSAKGSSASSSSSYETDTGDDKKEGILEGVQKLKKYRKKQKIKAQVAVVMKKEKEGNESSKDQSPVEEKISLNKEEDSPSEEDMEDSTKEQNQETFGEGTWWNMDDEEGDGEIRDQIPESQIKNLKEENNTTESEPSDLKKKKQSQEKEILENVEKDNNASESEQSKSNQKEPDKEQNQEKDVVKNLETDFYTVEFSQKQIQQKDLETNQAKKENEFAPLIFNQERIMAEASSANINQERIDDVNIGEENIGIVWKETFGELRGVVGLVSKSEKQIEKPKQEDEIKDDDDESWLNIDKIYTSL